MKSKANNSKSENQSQLIPSPEVHKENLIHKVIPLFLTSYPSSHTRLVYENSLQEFLDFWENKGMALYQFTDIQRFHIDAWQRSLESYTNYSPASISTKVSAVISFTRFLMENGWIEKNPGEFVKLPKISKTKGKTQALSEDEIKMILNKLEKEFLRSNMPTIKRNHYKSWLYYGIFLTMSTVGMRCSEFINLRLCDFQQSGNFYRLKLSLKGGEEHAPLIPQYLSQFILQFIKTCRSFATQNAPIFTLEVNSNEVIKREYLSKIITKVAKDFGIEKKISAHSLRSTVASLLHKSNVPVGEIKDLLGHKSIVTTMMYVRKTDEEKESAALKNPLSHLFNK